MTDLAPTHVPRSVLLRRLYRMARHPLPTFMDYAATYGPNVILSIVPQRVTHLTTDPAVARHVLQRNHRNYEKSEIQSGQLGKYLGRGLLTNTGSDWLRQRRLIQPGFHRHRIRELAVSMQDVIERECAAAAEGPVDLFAFTRRVAYRIVVRAIFTDGFLETEAREFQANLDRLQAFVIKPIRMPTLRPVYRWTGLERRYLKLARRSRALVADRIVRRRAAGSDHGDLLQMLLDSRYGDTAEAMSDPQLIDEIMILFAAGYETTANALAWAIYLLLRHPVQLERLESTLRAGTTDAERPDADDLLTHVIRESLRLYPPAWITDRVALEPDVAEGMTIARGTIVGVFIYGIHRSPLLYGSPDAFRPDRMTDAAMHARHPYAFLPFGGGPRRCVGDQFALLEMRMLLHHLITNYRVAALGEVPTLRPLPYVTLQQDRKLSVRLVRG